MDKIKKLQERLKKKAITAAQYKEQLKALLDSGDIEQDEYDDAEDFDPEEAQPIYTQEDMDRGIKSKALTMLRKALKSAGVELEGVSNRTLLDEVTKLAAAGVGKGTATDKEVTDLRKKAGRVDDLDAENRRLTLENVVLKNAGKYNPVNPVQVVRALESYDDLLIYDEDGALDPKSVNKALRRMAEQEPNLFKTSTDDDNDGGDGNNGDDQGGGGFGGKRPGGPSGGGKKTDAEKHDALKNEALKAMGFGQDKK